MQLSQVFSSFSVYIGIRQILMTLKNNNFSEPAQMIYALGKYNADLQYHQVDRNNIDKNGYANIRCVWYSGRYLIKVYFTTYISV